MPEENPSMFHSPEGPGRRLVGPRTWAPALVAFLAILTAVGVYALHERTAARGLVAERSDILASLDVTRGQIAALTDRVNELTAKQAATNNAGESGAPQAPRHRTVNHRRPAEDPRWKELQSQLAEQQKQIEANRSELGGTRTELEGSIARTHDELVVLERRGERNYFEFNLEKSGQFARQGPVGVRLRKASSKHQFADLELMVDDFKLSQKHVNLYQPVIFYSADGKQPVELVINAISNKRIQGYISAPKYKPTELEAMANSSTTPAATTNGAPGTTPTQPKQDLEPAKN